jgi:hypothetical protein
MVVGIFDEDDFDKFCNSFQSSLNKAFYFFLTNLLIAFYQQSFDELRMTKQKNSKTQPPSPYHLSVLYPNH